MLKKTSKSEQLEAEIALGRHRNNLIQLAVSTKPLVDETGFSARQLKYFSALARVIDNEEPGCWNPRPGKIPPHWHTTSKEALYQTLTKIRRGDCPGSEMFDGH